MSLVKYIASTVLHSVNYLIIMTHFCGALVRFSPFQEENVSILNGFNITRNHSQLFPYLKIFCLVLLCRTLATLAVTLATVWSFILQTLFVSYKELFEEKRERLNNNKKFLLSLAFLFLQSLGTPLKKALGTLLEVEFLVGSEEGGGRKE